MIDVRGLTKRFGDHVAVDDLTTTIVPGRVTGLLGPNGAGKTTTLRMVLGLDRPTAGAVTVAGVAYRELPAPARVVGALLDGGAFDGARTARAHLRWMALAAGLDRSRADEVLEQVGLATVADERTKGFSLGMAQRLGLAGALLGDPEVLLLDEPVNGLDPEGIRWIRGMVRGLAAEGRTVVVSSHLMREVEATADHVLVMGRGRLLADAPVHEITAAGTGARVVTPDADRLAPALVGAGASVDADRSVPGGLEVRGVEPSTVGEIAARHGVVLHELVPRRTTLEDAFFDLTGDHVEHRAASTDPAGPNDPSDPTDPTRQEA